MHFLNVFKALKRCAFSFLYVIVEVRWPSEASERCAALAAIADLITDLAKEDLLHLLRSLELTLLERQAADVHATPRRPPPLFERPAPPKPPSPPKPPAPVPPVPPAPEATCLGGSSSTSSTSSEGEELTALELAKQKKKDAAALEAIHELCAAHTERPWQVDGAIHAENFRRRSRSAFLGAFKGARLGLPNLSRSKSALHKAKKSTQSLGCASRHFINEIFRIATQPRHWEEVPWHSLSSTYIYI